MKEEVGSFTPDHEVEGSKRSRIRCILLCVTLITLVGLAVVLALAFTYATDPPGLLVHPMDMLVMTSWKDSSEVQRYVDSLNTFAAMYDNTKEAQSLKTCSEGKGTGDGQCLFSFTWLQSPCTKEESWGFKMWKPCILLSLNEPRDWVPEPYTSPDQLPEEMPRSLRRHIRDAFRNGNSTQFLWVSCGGEYPADIEFLGESHLSPWPGFPSYYFPMRHDTSQLATPVLALRVPDAETGVLISIRCHFWAKNLPSPHVAAYIEYLIICRCCCAPPASGDAGSCQCAAW